LRRLALIGLCLFAPVAATSQPPGRLATTADALRASPVFFHGKQVAILGTAVGDARDLSRIEPFGSTPAPGGAATSSRPIYAYWRERPSRSDGEIRGEVWDLGRLTEGDSRFSSYDFRPLLETVTNGRWPGRDQVFVILNATMRQAVMPSSPSLRAIALSPEKYENRSVTISGRFRGRNLYADLPAALPSSTKWDFVLQSSDAAVWVTGIRPKGRGFDLDPGARMDTGRWVEVTAMVRREGSRVWLEANEIGLSSEPEATPVEISVPSTPKEPPPTVIFSAPVPDEDEVEPGSSVRIQFSRDMDARSFKDRVRIAYRQPAQGGAAPAPPVFVANYNVGNRSLVIKFQKPLERFQQVTVELAEGVTAIDGQPLAPWNLTFTTGS
jgi:hypothetical protein